MVVQEVIFIPLMVCAKETPYLLTFFLLCAEGLSTLFAKLENEGSIREISICLNAPHVNHLLFADDSLLFCRAKTDECRQVMNALGVYERALGQKINLHKSEVCFSKNVKLPLGTASSSYWGLNVLIDMNDAWGCPPFWVEIVVPVLDTSKRDYGNIFKVGKENYLARLAKMFLLNS